MIRRLSCILLTILLCFTLSPRITFAAEHQQNNPSFFSLLEKSLLAFITSKEQVLADQIQPTATPTTLPTIEPTTQSIQAPQLSDVSAYILNGVNEYRASLDLSPVQSSAQTCAFAATRAKEITNGFTHDGFYSRVKNHTIPYATWEHATENIAEAPDYKEVVTLWKNSPEHAANMRDNTSYVCIEQYGNFYAYEGMRI